MRKNLNFTHYLLPNTLKAVFKMHSTQNIMYQLTLKNLFQAVFSLNISITNTKIIHNSDENYDVDSRFAL